MKCYASNQGACLPGGAIIMPGQSAAVLSYKALTKENRETIDLMAKELCKDYIAKSDDLANKHDLTALFKIGYGLYVVTSNDGKKDNGFICNAVTQVTSQPNRISVTINKDNYSHHIIKQAPDRFGDKELIAHKNAPAKSQIYRLEFNSSDSEFSFIADKIAELIKSGVKQSEIAVN